MQFQSITARAALNSQTQQTWMRQLLATVYVFQGTRDQVVHNAQRAMRPRTSQPWARVYARRVRLVPALFLDLATR